MVSIDLDERQRRARVRYERSRVWRAVLGFAPALLVVLLAALLGKRPSSVLAFGALLFALGVFILWYGRDIRRALLPGMAAGLLPLSFALCANHMGHLCTAEHCVSWCVPACTAGGLGAGLLVAYSLHRVRGGVGSWFAASGVALLTGAMGCTCVGYSGVVGLGLGYAVGLLPALSRRLFAREPNSLER